MSKYRHNLHYQAHAMHWTDEWKPTVTGKCNAREAAIAILNEIDWQAMIEEVGGFTEGDPLVGWGLITQLNDAHWQRGAYRRYRYSFTSHLTAWVTAHLEKVWWCDNERHVDAGGMSHFNFCDYESAEDPCIPGGGWALMGDPLDFLHLAMAIIRDGWEPETLADRAEHTISLDSFSADTPTWSLHCHHPKDDRKYIILEPGGLPDPDFKDVCRVMHWWEAIGIELLADDSPIEGVAFAVNVEFQGDDGPVLVIA